MIGDRLDRAAWKEFFDRVTKALEGKHALVEVASLKLGDQVEAEWLPLIGVTYDHKDDLIEVALDGVDHLIHHPREVAVEIGPEGLVAFDVVDKDGIHQIVRLKSPLLLPPPAQA